MTLQLNPPRNGMLLGYPIGVIVTWEEAQVDQHVYTLQSAMRYLMERYNLCYTHVRYGITTWAFNPSPRGIPQHVTLYRTISRTDRLFKIKTPKDVSGYSGLIFPKSCGQSRDNDQMAAAKIS